MKGPLPSVFYRTFVCLFSLLSRLQRVSTTGMRPRLATPCVYNSMSSATCLRFPLFCLQVTSFSVCRNLFSCDIDLQFYLVCSYLCLVCVSPSVRVLSSYFCLFFLSSLLCFMQPYFTVILESQCAGMCVNSMLQHLHLPI